MPTLRIPLFGSLINRNANPSSFNTKDQWFINCFPELVRNPISNSGRVFLYKRFGFSAAAVTGATRGSYGHVTWSGKADGTSPPLLSYLKTGGTNTMVFNATTQVGADIGTTSDCVSLTETIVGTTSNLVGTFVNSTTGLFEGWYFPEGGAWTKIASAAFPPNLGSPEPLVVGSGPVHMDGYSFWGTVNGKIWNSDQNSVSAYTANSYLTDQSYPDGLVGIGRYKNLIVAFGSQSISFYQNTGNPTGSPLTIVSNTTTRIGSIPVTGGSPYTRILSVGGTIYWIGQEAESGRKGVYRLNGYTPEKVSNPFIDKYINDSTLNAFHICGAFSMYGMIHVAFDFAIAGSGTTVIPCFCVDTSQWWIFSPGITNSYPDSIEGTGKTSQFSCNGGADKGKVFTSAQSSFTDDATAFTQTVQTQPVDFGTTNRKFFERIRPVCDVQTSASALLIEYSDDDYATWKTWGTIDLSVQAEIDRGLVGGGSGRRRAFRLKHSANTPNRMEAVDVTYSQGSD
jgi:hypothetical protein